MTMPHLINSKLQLMVRLNKSRSDYLQKFQELIDEYNEGKKPVDLTFAELVAFNQELDAEEKRTITENLTEEELALFDLLTRPGLHLSTKEKSQVKQLARDLLETLKHEKLVLDWRKRQQTRAQVQTTIERFLDKGLPALYTQELYEQKCSVVYQHVYDAYFGQGRSIYGSAA